MVLEPIYFGMYVIEIHYLTWIIFQAGLIPINWKAYPDPCYPQELRSEYLIEFG